MENKTSLQFHVQGMHCQSCVILIEDSLAKFDGVSKVDARLADTSVTVEGTFTDDAKTLSEKMTALVAPFGYRIALEKGATPKSFKELWYALPISVLFVAGFVLLQKAGIINLVTTDNVSYSTAFLIGIIASLSTCLAVVGGLTLSVFTSYAKAGQKIRPQVMFHIGRLVTFFVLGGVIGAAGGIFKLSITANAVLGLAVAAIMLLLGINMLDVFSFTKKIQPTLPAFLSKKTVAMSATKNIISPLLLGFATFFLPCGFTQSMQFYTLTAGSFWNGAMIMGTFALGTLPMLALLTFSSFTISNKPWRGVFYKTAGLVVVFLALFNVMNALVLLGVMNPLFTL